MARNFFSLTNSVKIALVAATAKTVLQMVAASGVRAALQAITISFDGNTSSAVPVLVQLYRETTAGTGTSRNPSKKDNDLGTALQVTGFENFTVEPTYGDLLHEWLVHPQAGAQIPLPMPGEYIASATQGGGRMGIVVTAPAAVNTVVTLEGEE